MEKKMIKDDSKRTTLGRVLLNSTVYGRKAIRYGVFSIVLFGAIGCSSSRNVISSDEGINKWEIAKIDKGDSPNWIIYTRKIAGTNFLEYKIEGDVQSSPTACVTSFRQDIYNQANDLENKKFPTYQIVNESKDSLTTYVIHNEPFPLKDTEMSVRYIFYNDEEGSAGVRWNEAWDSNSTSPSKKLNRVETFRGQWNFSLVDADACDAVNSVSFDPKKMPLWLIEPMVFKFLKNGLEDLRETTAEQ
ncbi:MAG: hypothetical protein ACJASQ_002884 [Crocinitomicaceae bacterium]|jgi:hypothetical protein